jgi:phosphopantothenoylcysteine synthetase/decarboxylase
VENEKVMKKTVVIGVAGSSACWKVCALIEELQKKMSGEVIIRVVMTHSSAHFIQPLMFQILTHQHVYLEVADEPDVEKISHVHLAQSCDLFLVAPATFNTIGKLAQGVADNMLTTVASAVPAATPKFLAPAMNDAMYNQEVLKENLAKLKERGYEEIPPRVDILASGKKAIGALAEVSEIVALIVEKLQD